MRPRTWKLASSSSGLAGTVRAHKEGYRRQIVRGLRGHVYHACAGYVYVEVQRGVVVVECTILAEGESNCEHEAGKGMKDREPP